MQVGDRIECMVLRRVNRFVVEVSIGGSRLRAHINNTGRLERILEPGTRGLCRPLKRGTRTRYRLWALGYRGSYAVIDTRLQEDSLAEAISRGLIPWARHCVVSERWPKLGSSRLDLAVKCGDSVVYIETKSAVMPGPRGSAMYPDCPTPRGRRHIEELIEYVERGGKAVLVFIAALPGASMFMVNRSADPALADLVARAIYVGVDVRAIGIEYDISSGYIVLYDPDLPVVV